MAALCQILLAPIIRISGATTSREKLDKTQTKPTMTIINNTINTITTQLHSGNIKILNQDMRDQKTIRNQKARTQT